MHRREQAIAYFVGLVLFPFVTVALQQHTGSFALSFLCIPVDGRDGDRRNLDGAGTFRQEAERNHRVRGFRKQQLSPLRKQGPIPRDLTIRPYGRRPFFNSEAMWLVIVATFAGATVRKLGSAKRYQLRCAFGSNSPYEQ